MGLMLEFWMKKVMDVSVDEQISILTCGYYIRMQFTSHMVNKPVFECFARLDVQPALLIFLC